MDFEKAKAEAEELKNRLNSEEVNPDEKRLAELKAAIEAEEKRLNSKAYKNALKAVDEMEAEAETLKAQAFKMVDDILAVMDEWEAVTKKRWGIAVKNSIETKDLYWVDSIKADELAGLKRKIEGWKSIRKIYKTVYTKPHDVKRREILEDETRKEMVEARYPKVGKIKTEDEMMAERYPKT